MGAVLLVHNQASLFYISDFIFLLHIFEIKPNYKEGLMATS